MILLSERQNASYKKHSVQVDLRDQTSEKDFFFERLQELVPDAMLYRKYPRVPYRVGGSVWELVPGMTVDDPHEEYGREDEPHITVCYGLLDENDLFKIMRYCATVEPFDVQLGDVTMFINKPEYDVVKVDIVSPMLHKINAWIRDNCKVEVSYPNYTPHMTLAYVKKNSIHPAFIGKNLDKGKRIQIRSLEFSRANHGGKLPLPLKIL